MPEYDDISPQTHLPTLPSARGRGVDYKEENRLPSSNTRIELGTIPTASPVHSPANQSGETTPQPADPAHHDYAQEDVAIRSEQNGSTSAQNRPSYPTYPLPIAPDRVAKALQLQLRRDTWAHGRALIREDVPEIQRSMKTRYRKPPLDPTTIAKAALVRHLGSCWVCRIRHVPCPLGHHDIATLEKLWHNKEEDWDRRETATSSALDVVIESDPPLNFDRAQEFSSSTSPQPYTSDYGTRRDDNTSLTSILSTATNPADKPKCRLCKILRVLWLTIIAGSLGIGLWRSIVTADEGKGFTDAAYVVAVGGLVLYPVQDRHSRKCKAERENRHS
ncbi:uncharacterized protein PAC_12962 [Phialocephala subalpina]|uniref:Uncharacterized protein n=1 Tax=Phialocephala subalpina TaxID=576137 RepID=A0A1L7XDF4_9HELO|nr:uncharacterized protein PAC_12962 [Phialocephala subalpina]